MTVNLLPWREQLRAQRRRAFLLLLPGVMMAAAVVVLLVDRQLRGEIHEQRTANELLQREVVTADASIEEIGQLSRRQQNIAGQLAALRQLQDMRPTALSLFEQVARAVPADIQLNLLQRQQGQLQIEGLARSSSAVAELMRRFANAERRFQPYLQSITAADASGGQGEAALADVFVLALTPVSATAAVPAKPDEDG